MEDPENYQTVQIDLQGNKKSVYPANLSTKNHIDFISTIDEKNILIYMLLRRLHLLSKNKDMHASLLYAINFAYHTSKKMTCSIHIKDKSLEIEFCCGNKNFKKSQSNIVNIIKIAFDEVEFTGNTMSLFKKFA